MEDVLRIQQQTQAALQKQIDRLQAEVSELKSDNTALRQRMQESGTVSRGVSPLGVEEEDGRRLSPAAVCCRWTPGGTCTSGVSRECTHIHEYLEAKAATHEFADIDACLTPTQANWLPSFDGVTGNISINGGYPFPTPLKIHHAATAPAFKWLHSSACAGNELPSAEKAQRWAALTSRLRTTKAASRPRVVNLPHVQL